MSAHLERLIRIYDRLKRGPVTIEIVSNWTRRAGIEVSDRQLYRDLEKLTRKPLVAGEVVKEFINEKNKKTWKLEYGTNSEKISTFDINSFFLVKNFAPLAVLKERKKSIEKFERILYESFSQNNYQQYIQANELYMRKTNYGENMYGEEEHEKIEELIWCLHNQRIIIVEHDSINGANNDLSDTPYPIEMYPLELLFHRGRMYVGGFTISMQLFVFAIDKDFIFTLTNETFNRQKFIGEYARQFSNRFAISRPTSEKVHHIRIEVTRDYANSIKSFFWHHSQSWTELENGNYLLSLHSTISRELVGFIAQGLAMIKVHEPEELKNLVLRKFKETIELYETDIEMDGNRANEGL